MNTLKKKFKGFDYYKLHSDKDGNLKLSDYDDVLNARRARVDLLLDNLDGRDVNFLKLNKALSERFSDDEGLLCRFYKEDQKIAEEEFKMFSVLDNIDNLASIESEDLLEVSLLLSDLSFVERNIILNISHTSDLMEFKNLFTETKPSGEEYSDKECKKFLDNIDEINTLIQLELEDRIKKLSP